MNWSQSKLTVVNISSERHSVSEAANNIGADAGCIIACRQHYYYLSSLRTSYLNTAEGLSFQLSHGVSRHVLLHSLLHLMQCLQSKIHFLSSVVIIG